MRHIAAALGLLVVTLGAQAAAPSYELRRQTLASLVNVRATDCPDGDRAASGFVLERGERIVTAHHAVGGCRRVVVSFEGAEKNKLRPARIVRVHAAGDLALLEVDNAPAAARPLRMAATAPDPESVFAGLGYALNMPTASDIEVRFAVGARRLRDILPPEAATELERNRSRIAIDREVLRFNVALQPGMSGGPIIDATGAVIGVVAGGLKAGAAPASWGWPSENVRLLLASTEPVDQRVESASTHYSLRDMERVSQALSQNRRLRCGELDFSYAGTRSLNELWRGADDPQRVQYLLQLLGANANTFEAEAFQVWLHRESGATAVLPSGLELRQDGRSCVARSGNGAFEVLVWGAVAAGPVGVEARPLDFENQIVRPRLGLVQFRGMDPHLTIGALDPMSGTYLPQRQMRADGMVFLRKGWFLSHTIDPRVGLDGHLFETLAARSNSFLGVALINHRRDPMLDTCASAPTTAMCAPAMAHLREWARYILATQLSTYPTF